MVYLVDTNVLLRFADRTHPLHPTIRATVRKLRADGHELRATAQNFVEYWNVATRPAAKNGFGLSPLDADQHLQLIERLFALLPDSPATYPEWRRLAVVYSVSGVQVHDARLVAAMIATGVKHILTLNSTDFLRYAPEGIVTVDPQTVAAM
jgi:predicted nucleic acid-binding protein